ncbi:unnamed protein product [Closterium sp. NIES-65]|nr:unnamed protein product [Closterium sp. NIES-65]
MIVLPGLTSLLVYAGWKRWSDPNTWGKQSLLPWDKKPKGWPFRLGVPGRGLLQWRDVTIPASALFPLSPSSPSPCGAAILLDVTDVRVGKPKIKGWLKYFHLLSHPHPLMPACLSRCRLSASSSSWCM